MTKIYSCFVKQMMVAVVSLLGFCGIGHSMNLQISPVKAESFSRKDSLIVEMVEFIQPDYKPNKSDRNHIESRIKKFPSKIVKRDTIGHFLNTAYAIAYYEFVKHDFKRAKKLSEDFVESSMPPGFFAYFFNYSSIGLNASNSLQEKGKLKVKKDKNSWYTPIKFEWADSMKWDFKRSYVDFLDSFIDDVPMDCATSTYEKLLSVYHDGGGKLEFLNGYSRRGFIQRCVDSGRDDILNIVYSLWSVRHDDFSKNYYGWLGYNNSTIKIDSVATRKVYNEILSFDVETNKRQIDSLIFIHADVDLTPRIIRLANLYFNQYRYTELVEACERLQNFVSGISLNTLHNYWALGLSNLGKYEEALNQYDLAIANSTNSRIISTMKMNKASTLGEMGRTGEAVSLFMGEKNLQSTPFEKFVWNDNLGYAYSFTDPAKALYYYTEAEKYMDSGTLDLDRKVRHFCRKAKVLDYNKFLQRTSIEKALDYSRKYGCSDVAKGMAYSVLADFAHSTYDYPEADRLFEKVFDYYKILTPNNLRLIDINRLYALNLSKLNRNEEAVQILTHQLELIESAYGNQNNEYIQTLCAMIQLSCLQVEDDIDVNELYRRFEKVKELSATDLLRFEIIKTDALYLEYIGNSEGATKVLSNALKISLNPMQRLYIIQSLNALSRNHLDAPEYVERLTSLISPLKSAMIGGLLCLSGDEEKAFHNSLTDIINDAIENGAYQSALELSLFRKGLLFTKKKTIEKKLSGKRSVKNAYKQLKVIREELNRAVAFNDSSHIPDLTLHVFQLEREIATQLVNNRKLYTELDRTPEQVSDLLSAKDLAVEFIRYSHGNQTKYGAFLLDKNGLIKFVSLGNEEDLIAKPAAVWYWLKEYIGFYNDLYFCGDGVLNTLGLEYLAIDGQAPINQQINIHRVFHLSEIERHSSYLGNRVLIIGVSDHNSPIKESENVNRGNWTNLPNVEYELQLVANNLKESAPRMLINDEAIEPIVTSSLTEDISALHISTHGFYRSNQMLKESANNPTHDDYHVARRFLSGGLTEVSGLVLRQGNISWKSPYIMEEYDDLLTAEEIELMSFPNLNLTVLSACETGLGEIDSDGVWGLQRAFRIAGTKNLICTLAKVDDYWTAQFMDAFYEHVANGNTIYDSFQTAQRWLRKELPDNPEIWSSFILIE